MVPLGASSASPPLATTAFSASHSACATKRRRRGEEKADERQLREKGHGCPALGVQAQQRRWRWLARTIAAYGFSGCVSLRLLSIASIVGTTLWPDR